MTDSMERLLSELPRMAEAANAFASPDVQRDAFRELMREFRGDADAPVQDDDAAGDGEVVTAKKTPTRKPKGATNAGAEPAAKPRARRGASDAPDGDLNLRPAGVQSFADFVKEKKPQIDHERSVVAVYWLRNIAKAKAGPAQVAACFLGMKWRLPVDMRKALARTASKKRWLDTSNMDDVKLFNAGQNLVLYDLPHAETEANDG